MAEKDDLRNIAEIQGLNFARGKAVSLYQATFKICSPHQNTNNRNPPISDSVIEHYRLIAVSYSWV